MDKDAVRVIVGMEVALCEVKRGQKKLGENGEIDKKNTSLDEVQQKIRRH